MFNITSFKFIGGFAGLIILGLFVWYAAIYLSPDARQERDVLEYFADLEEQYKNDTYGGKTPEETLALFIAALEKGDIELASKYFLPEDQAPTLKKLSDIKQSGNLDQVATDFNRARNGKEIFEGRYQFTVIKSGTNIAQFTIGLVKNPVTEIWKLEALF